MSEKAKTTPFGKGKKVAEDVTLRTSGPQKPVKH